MLELDSYDVIVFSAKGGCRIAELERELDSNRSTKTESIE